MYLKKELFLVKGFMPMMAVDPCNPSAHNFGMHSFETFLYQLLLRKIDWKSKITVAQCTKDYYSLLLESSLYFPGIGVGRGE